MVENQYWSRLLPAFVVFVLASLAAASQASSATPDACRELEIKLQLIKPQITSIETNQVLFASADNGCSELARRLLSDDASQPPWSSCSCRAARQSTPATSPDPRRFIRPPRMDVQTRSTCCCAKALIPTCPGAPELRRWLRQRIVATTRSSRCCLRIAPIRHWRIRQARHRSYMRRRAALHRSSSGCWMLA